jgi:hypothetical protein
VDQCAAHRSFGRDGPLAMSSVPAAQSAAGTWPVRLRGRRGEIPLRHSTTRPIPSDAPVISTFRLAAGTSDLHQSAVHLQIDARDETAVIRGQKQS